MFEASGSGGSGESGWVGWGDRPATAAPVGPMAATVADDSGVTEGAQGRDAS